MAGTLQIDYGANGQVITCGFASTVATHGRISNSLTNSLGDVLLFAKVKSGSGALSGNEQIVIYGLGSVDGGSTYTDGFTIGDADSAVAPTNARPILIMPIGAVSTQYYGGPVAVSLAFGGVVPQDWGIYVFNDTGATVDATSGNFAFLYQAVYGQYT